MDWPIVSVLFLAAVSAGLLFLLYRARAAQPVAVAQPPENAAAQLQARLDGMYQMLADSQSRLNETVNNRLDSVSARLGASLETSKDATTANLKLLAEQLGESMNTRLDAVSHRLGASLETSKDATTQNLKQLAERLAVIDAAQKGVADLAGQVTSLTGVLANKQARGAFGQWRMETIVQDNLPQGTYAFQATLSNRTRPDCVIHMPDKRSLVIDSKFPLEATTAYRDATSEEGRKLAAARVRSDLQKHIAEIAGKYLLPGETQDVAFMFVPSEAVYAELHESFDDVVQKAYRAKIFIVSPTVLMLAIHVLQQMRRDERMREATDLIRDEVVKLLNDVGRLGDRVRKMSQHFGQVTEDARQALLSLEKVEKRGEAIRQAEVGQPAGLVAIAAQ
jgi:DNA recombination protein RmuC